MVNRAPFLSKPKTFKRWAKRMITRNTNPASQVSIHEQGNQQGVFGVPLVESISYARKTVGYQDTDENNHDHAAAIPLVVAKCGSYLKSQGLDTEGVFRLSGNTKRINTLQRIFDSPLDSYGLHHDWQGYTVHDAATLLRRYFLSLPDPVIPASFYQRFRDVMDKSLDDEPNQRVDAFQTLICQLPTAHQHLLFYVLDLLHSFSTNASATRMDTANLAEIFSSGLIDQPLLGQQPTSPDTTSINVVTFLIQHQPLFTMDLLVENEAQLVDIDEALVSPNIYRQSFSPSLSHTTPTTSSVSSAKSYSTSLSVTLPQPQHLETCSLDSSLRADLLSPSLVNHRQPKNDYFTRSVCLYSTVTAQLKDHLHGAVDWIIRQSNHWWHHAEPPLLLGWYFTLVIVASATAYEGHLILDDMAIVEPCAFFGGMACFMYLFIYGIITTSTTTTTDFSSSSASQNLSDTSGHNEDNGFERYDDEPKPQLDSNQSLDETNYHQEWNKIVD